MKVNGVSANSAQLIPGAEVVEANNPSTGANDGTVVVEANNVAWTTGDTVASGPIDENFLTGIAQQIIFAGATSPSLAQGLIGGGRVDNPCDNCRFSDWIVAGNPANYVGGGGTRPITFGGQNYFGNPLMHYYLLGSAPDNGGWITKISDCGIRICTDPAANFTENEYDAVYGGTFYGNYVTKWSNYNLTHNTNIGDVNGNGHSVIQSPIFYDRKLSGPNYYLAEIDLKAGSLSQMQVGNDHGGTYLNLTPSQAVLNVYVDGVVSNFIQTPSSFSMDKPAKMVAGSTIDSKLPCLQDGTNCPASTSTSVASQATVAAVAAGTCSHIQQAVNGLTQTMTISVSSQSDPGAGVTTTLPYWSTPNVANFSVCAPPGKCLERRHAQYRR